jgi:hypothetical protein
MFICKQHYVLRSSFKKSIQVEKSFHICEECIWWRNVFKLSASERWNTTSILKKLLYQQRHYPRDDIETSTHNVFGEDAWRESERWKFHERKFFLHFHRESNEFSSRIGRGKIFVQFYRSYSRSVLWTVKHSAIKKKSENFLPHLSRSRV